MTPLEHCAGFENTRTFECAAINPIVIEEKGATFILRTLALECESVQTLP